jgi:adenylate kinase
MNLIFLGAPGSGKGTQADRLARHTGIVHVSTGELLRTAVREDTELGRQAERYMTIGELVPDSVLIGLIEVKMNNGSLTDGFILDGFPRTIPQAEALDGMFVRHKTKLDRAVLLFVEDEEIIKRLSGRMQCPTCNAGYHYPMNMPRKDGMCDNCGATLSRRADDEFQIIRNRLEVYRRQTRPIEDYYRRQSKFLEISGVGNPDDIFKRLLCGLGIDKTCLN